VKRSPLGRIWPNLTAVVLFLLFTFPVYWMFATAFKPTGDIISEDPVWFPTDATFEHFRTAMAADHFWTMVGNSITVTVCAVVFSLIIGVTAAFALARMRFKGRRGFIIGFMLAQMAPWEVMVIAIYIIVRDADMLNSLIPLTLFYMVMILPFTLLTLRGFVAAVPKELEESAMVDGCTRMQAFRRVILPLLAPGLMATSLRLHHRLERVPAGPRAQQGSGRQDPADMGVQLPDRLRRRLGRHHGRGLPLRHPDPDPLRLPATQGRQRPDRRRSEGITPDDDTHDARR
jgi:N,N'-diacetylchitobiose transport system permease protein